MGVIDGCFRGFDGRHYSACKRMVRFLLTHLGRCVRYVLGVVARASPRKRSRGRLFGSDAPDHAGNAGRLPRAKACARPHGGGQSEIGRALRSDVQKLRAARQQARKSRERMIESQERCDMAIRKWAQNRDKLDLYRDEIRTKPRPTTPAAKAVSGN